MLWLLLCPPCCRPHPASVERHRALCHGATGSPALGSPWVVDGVGSSRASPPPPPTFGADLPTASYQPSPGRGGLEIPRQLMGEMAGVPRPPLLTGTELLLHKSLELRWGSSFWSPSSATCPDLRMPEVHGAARGCLGFSCAGGGRETLSGVVSRRDSLVPGPTDQKSPRTLPGFSGERGSGLWLVEYPPPRLEGLSVGMRGPMRGPCLVGRWVEHGCGAAGEGWRPIVYLKPTLPSPSLPGTAL